MGGTVAISSCTINGNGASGVHTLVLKISHCPDVKMPS
jgi:hypothetical protein